MHVNMEDTMIINNKFVVNVEVTIFLIEQKYKTVLSIPYA